MKLRRRESREELARRVAREEVASLSGLVLMRLSENQTPLTKFGLQRIFGEALRDFGATLREPGPDEEDAS